MLGVRFAVSISHNRLFGTRSLGLRRKVASSRVRRSTSDMESPKLSRRARRRLPAVRGVVGIVGSKLPQTFANHRASFGESAPTPRSAIIAAQGVSAMKRRQGYKGYVNTGVGSLGAGSACRRPATELVLTLEEAML